MEVNIAVLTGRLTRDVELRHISGGKAVATLGLASSEKWRGQNGQDREEVLFVDVDVWGGMAEAVARNCQKGSKVTVEGKLKLDQWEDREGNRRSKVKINASKVLFEWSQSGDGGGQRSGSVDPDDDEIPF